jgi:hypothetical protein
MDIDHDLSKRRGEVELLQTVWCSGLVGYAPSRLRPHGIDETGRFGFGEALVKRFTSFFAKCLQA